MCIEPLKFQVEENTVDGQGKRFVNTKLMTRQTYTLSNISGKIKIDGGNFVFEEEDGIDYAATTL